MSRRIARDLRRVGYASGIVAAWALAAIGYLALSTFVADARAVERVREVRGSLEATRASLRDAENHQRRFLLTEDPADRRACEEALRRLDTALTALTASVAHEDESQRSRARAVDEAARARGASLREGLEIRVRSGLPSAIAHVRRQGREATRDLARVLREMEAFELALLAEARATVARARVVGFVVLVAHALFATGLLLWLARRARRERASAESFAARLEDEVRARTREIRAEVVMRQAREEELEELAAELERSNRELNDFAFIASHDLQEPLRKIRAFGDRIVSDHSESLDAEARDFLDRMQNAAERMSRLISDLLTFSRVHRKGQPFAQVALADVFQDVATDLEQRVQDTGGRIVLPPEMPTIAADASQMRQLFQNLVGNALKFHPVDRGTTVEVRATLCEDTVEIRVIDDGIGFDPKYKEKIFGPFQRLHGRNVYEGTGIGLAICRRIVERHEGSIDVTSEPGRGTTFVVTLPIRQMHERPTSDRPASGETDTSERQTSERQTSETGSERQTGGRSEHG